MQLRFYKHTDGRWYVDLPTWEGDFEDLEMVAGADDLLEVLSHQLKTKSITFEVWTRKPDVPCGLMTKIDQTMDGATYQVSNCMYYDSTAWLCNVTKFVFDGIHPNHIYFRVVNEDNVLPTGLTEKAKDYSSRYDLQRFLTAQERDYPEALEEMRNGRKTGHWIWYIFPQQKGLGHSYNSQYYGLDGLDEAKAYLQHPVLGQRLREICQALLDNRHKSIRHIMGSDIDVLKLQTSMQLFDLASPNDIFDKVLRAFF